MGAIVYCVGVKEFNQTQVGGGYRGILKMWPIPKKGIQDIIFFLWLCVFLACNYCRHCGACVSCVGRIPGPQGNH